mmetsp:Transcript_24684/g.79704  ORF Transcript_24684/g.79704 Transcript_24684/m.79704 type:complete len:369 (+) Transcript_24684:1303-2409(+)
MASWRASPSKRPGEAIRLSELSARIEATSAPPIEATASMPAAPMAHDRPRKSTLPGAKTPCGVRVMRAMVSWSAGADSKRSDGASSANAVRPDESKTAVVADGERATMSTHTAAQPNMTAPAPRHVRRNPVGPIGRNGPTGRAERKATESMAAHAATHAQTTPSAMAAKEPRASAGACDGAFSVGKSQAGTGALLAAAKAHTPLAAQPSAAAACPARARIGSRCAHSEGLKRPTGERSTTAPRAIACAALLMPRDRASKLPSTVRAEVLNTWCSAAPEPASRSSAQLSRWSAMAAAASRIRCELIGRSAPSDSPSNAAHAPPPRMTDRYIHSKPRTKQRPFAPAKLQPKASARRSVSVSSRPRLAPRA